MTISGALSAICPTAGERVVRDHRIPNVFDKLPERLQLEAESLVAQIPTAGTRAAAERANGAESPLN
jgi:hypothetical protein